MKKMKKEGFVMRDMKDVALFSRSIQEVTFPIFLVSLCEVVFGV